MSQYRKYTKRSARHESREVLKVKEQAKISAHKRLLEDISKGLSEIEENPILDLTPTDCRTYAAVRVFRPSSNPGDTLLLRSRQKTPWYCSQQLDLPEVDEHDVPVCKHLKHGTKLSTYGMDKLAFASKPAILSPPMLQTARRLDRLNVKGWRVCHREHRVYRVARMTPLAGQVTSEQNLAFQTICQNEHRLQLYPQEVQTKWAGIRPELEDVMDSSVDPLVRKAKLDSIVRPFVKKTFGPADAGEGTLRDFDHLINSSGFIPILDYERTEGAKDTTGQALDFMIKLVVNRIPVNGDHRLISFRHLLHRALIEGSPAISIPLDDSNETYGCKVLRTMRLESVKSSYWSWAGYISPLQDTRGEMDIYKLETPSGKFLEWKWPKHEETLMIHTFNYGTAKIKHLGPSILSITIWHKDPSEVPRTVAIAAVYIGAVSDILTGMPNTIYRSKKAMVDNVVSGNLRVDSLGHECGGAGYFEGNFSYSKHHSKTTYVMNQPPPTTDSARRPYTIRSDLSLHGKNHPGTIPLPVLDAERPIELDLDEDEILSHSAVGQFCKDLTRLLSKRSRADITLAMKTQNMISSTLRQHSNPTAEQALWCNRVLNMKNVPMSVWAMALSNSTTDDLEDDIRPPNWYRNSPALTIGKSTFPSTKAIFARVDLLNTWKVKITDKGESHFIIENIPMGTGKRSMDSTMEGRARKMQIMENRHLIPDSLAVHFPHAVSQEDAEAPIAEEEEAGPSRQELEDAGVDTLSLYGGYDAWSDEEDENPYSNNWRPSFLDG